MAIGNGLSLISNDELKKIVERHQHFLNSDCKNWQDMQAIFLHTSFENMNLSGLNLRGAIFISVSFNKAKMKNINLHGATFQYATFYRTDCEGADLGYADFLYSSLCKTNLTNADLTGVNLCCSSLDDAILTNTKMPNVPLVCPDSGAFIGWKKCIADNAEYDVVNAVIVKLLIPEDAKRLSGIGRKCRCDKATVLEIKNMDGKDINKAYSIHDTSFVYKVGETVSVSDFNDNRWVECTEGIHFFINKQEAIDY